MHLDINARLYSVLGKWTKCETELWCSQLTELQRDMVHSSQLCSGGEQMRGNQGCRGQPATQKPTKLPSPNNWQTRADELAVNALITQTKVEQSTSRARLSWAGLGCFSQSWFRPLCGVIGGGCKACSLQSMLCNPQASLGMQRGSDSHHLWAFYIWHNLLVDISYIQ